MPQALADSTLMPAFWFDAETMLPRQKDRVPTTQKPRPARAVASKPAPVLPTWGAQSSATPRKPSAAPVITRRLILCPKSRKPSSMLKTAASENTTDSSPEGTLRPP
jgi:hypothetical protein